MKMSQQTPASLCSLPQELIDNTLSFMERPADISSLSMVSKKLRELTVGALFSDISMGWKCKEHPQMTCSKECHQTDTPRIHLLLRTLIEMPLLAEQVTKVNFQTRGFRSAYSRQLPPRVQLPTITYPTSYRSAVRGALARIHSGDQNFTDDLIQGILDNRFEAVVTAVLLISTRLAVVILDSNIFRRNHFLGPILRHILPDPSVVLFKHLKTFKLGKCPLPSEDTIAWPDRPFRYYPNDSLDLSSYLPLFYIQGLQEAAICLPGLATGAKFEWPTPTAPVSSALHTLKLLECRLMPEELHNILSTTPNLQNLEYACWMPEWCIFNATAFSIALGSVRNTLQHLKVTLFHWEHDNFVPRDFWMGSDWVEGHCPLKHLSQLKTLSISSCVLLGWYFDEAPALLDVLPPHIISLALTDDESSSYQQDFWWYEEKLFIKFQALFSHQDWRTMLPHIRKIYMDYSDWDKETTLDRMCEENGLIFKQILTW